MLVRLGSWPSQPPSNIHAFFILHASVYCFICLMIAGVCDLFDGAIARRVKRTEEEKAFGIQLDSLVDVVDFIALPICIFMGMGMMDLIHLGLYLFYAVTGIARIGYFNVVTADGEAPVKYYSGLPVTYVALIFPMVYLLKYVVSYLVFAGIFTATIPVVAVLELLKVRILKPRGIGYVLFGLLAVGMILVYWLIF